MKQISFYGASGAEYVLAEVIAGIGGLSGQGVAVFTAPDSYGRRVIRVIETDGNNLLSAFLAAHHYGANAVFVIAASDTVTRTKMVADLEAGLNPVMVSGSRIFAAAA